MTGVGPVVAFWIIAVVCVGSAVAVVLLRDIFRAALFLILCFFSVAGVYVTLNADFIAAVQVLIYVGAIAVLLIFAIMLTREKQRGSPTGRLGIPAFLVAAALLGTMIYSMVKTEWSNVAAQVPPIMEQPLGDPTTGNIAGLLFGEGGFILPFEIAAVLLLAVVIGAIVLAREK